MKNRVCITPYVLHQIGGVPSDKIGEARRIESELLRACKACYESLYRFRRLMGRNGIEVEPDVIERIRELGREHLGRKGVFQETLLTRCNGGSMQLELGKAYMDRCTGGMRGPDGVLFVCSQQTVGYYLADVRVKPPEEPPQSI